MSYQGTVGYQCKDGYVLVGRSNLLCDADGRWNGPPPRCEPVLCPNPPLIANGYATLMSNSTMFGSVVEYTCDPNHELIGERQIVCNVAGYWDGQPGYCLGKFREPLFQSFLIDWHLQRILLKHQLHQQQQRQPPPRPPQQLPRRRHPPA